MRSIHEDAKPFARALAISMRSPVVTVLFSPSFGGLSKQKTRMLNTTNPSANHWEWDGEGMGEGKATNPSANNWEWDGEGKGRERNGNEGKGKERKEKEGKGK